MHTCTNTCTRAYVYVCVTSAYGCDTCVIYTHTYIYTYALVYPEILIPVAVVKSPRHRRPWLSLSCAAYLLCSLPE